MSDIMKTLFFVVILNFYSAFSKHESRLSSDCVGPWRPVFKPSQPDTIGNDVHGFAVNGKSLRSDDSDVNREITHVFVPVTKPNAYRLEHKLAEVNHPGYDTSVQDFVSSGKHTLQWDHYGDVSYVQNQANSGNYNNGQDTLPEHDNGDFNDGYMSNNDTHHDEHHDEHYANDNGGSDGNAEDEKFFNSDSFFEEHTENPLENPDDFSEEGFNESGPSSEHNRETNKNYDGERRDEEYVKKKRPTASSYASITAVYNRYNDEQHPHEYNDHGGSTQGESGPYKTVWTHYKGPAEYLHNVEENGEYYVDYGTHNDNNNGVHSGHVYNHIPPSNPNRPIKQYSVHETPEEDEVEPSVVNQPMNILYSKPELNENEFNDFWRKDSRSTEELRPPPPPHFPLTSTSLFYTKTPRRINHRVFNKRQNVRKPFSYVYVLKTLNSKSNKRL